MPLIMPNVRKNYIDENGQPLVGGKLYSYIAGTTTPKATYQNYELSTANTNPIILDSKGSCDVWLATDELYKFELYNSSDVLQWSEDNVGEAASTESVFGSIYNFTIPNNQSSFLDITSFFFDVSKFTSISYEVEVLRKFTGSELRQSGTLKFIYNSTTNLVECLPFLNGDDAGVEFQAVVSSGTIFKVQLTSTNMTSTGYSGNLKFQSRGGM
jgi:hypothetical protein